MRLAVIGAGVAGVAAAWSACRKGAQICVFDGGGGATQQSCGAADVQPWHVPFSFPPAARSGPAGATHDRLGQEQLGSTLEEFFQELGWDTSSGPVPQERGRTVATASGVLRPARLCDPLVLDLNAVSHSGSLVLVGDVGRADFPAEQLARAYQEVTQGQLVFRAKSLSPLFSEEELAWPLAAFSRLMDGERVKHLIEVARGALKQEGAQALLVGPWLGIDQQVAFALGGSGLILGETTSPPDGPAGQRLAQGLCRLLSRIGVICEERSVERLDVDETGVTVLPGGQRFDRVIVATGGLIGGGLGLFREPGGSIGSRLLPETIEEVGSWAGWDAAQDGGAFLTPGAGPGLGAEPREGRVLAAGDVRKGSYQTLLSAALDGISAGQRAAQSATPGQEESVL